MEPEANGEGQTEDATTVIAVSCGSSHTVALLDCNVVVSWGRGEDGQLGHGDADACLEPKAIHALIDKDISSVMCGAEYTVAVSANQRQVYSWGWGDFGRLGHGDSSDVFLPQAIAFFSGMPIASVACGDTHTLVVSGTGDLFSFGRNQNGQLGHGNSTDVLSPKQVEAFKGTPITSVACGAEHSVAATAEGHVFAWGWGRYGNLGDGDRADRHTPTRVHGLEGVRVAAVACGWRHSAAVSDAGRVWTFGWSKYGQLGHGDFSDRLVPTEVEALSGKVVTVVAGGWRHTAAADSDGRCYTWGWNKFGQLGQDDDVDRNAPTEVAAFKEQPLALLACGWRHTVAVTRAGDFYSWGRGVNGQLGHGDEVDLRVPKRLDALCSATLRRSAVIATAAAPGGYVALADRYAVVPDGQDGVPEGAGGEGDAGASADASEPAAPASSGTPHKRQRLTPISVSVGDAAVPEG